MADKPGRVEPGRTVFIGNIPYGTSHLHFTELNTNAISQI